MTVKPCIDPKQFNRFCSRSKGGKALEGVDKEDDASGRRQKNIYFY